MTRHSSCNRWGLAMLLAGTALIQGCDQAPVDSAASAVEKRTTEEPADTGYTSVEVSHKLGTTWVEQRPARVVALDMNEVDFLDQLDVDVVGMPKDFVPHFLSQYKEDAEVLDLGAIVQPNLERVHAAKPDLILISALHAQHYEELSEIAPTIHFDVDYRNSSVSHIDIVRGHLMTLGRVFAKESLAREKAAGLDSKIREIRQVTEGRDEKALVVLHNNGAFSSFGPQSRYGFVFSDLGVKPAAPEVDTGLHGQPVSSEFIHQAGPDIIYIVDRTAVMEGRPVLTAESLNNPLLKQTPAWRNGRVVFVDAEAWYVTAASVNSLNIIIDDLLKGYQG